MKNKFKKVNNSTMTSSKKKV